MQLQRGVSFFSVNYFLLNSNKVQSFRYGLITNFVLF